VTTTTKIPRRVFSAGLVASLAAASGLARPAIAADDKKINFKIASGHNASWHFIQITQKYFMPELKKRVKERTGYEVEFTEGFAGAMVKATEVLAGTQSGIIDIGVFCICHEGQKLALHNFPYYLPFGPNDPVISVKATRKVYNTIPNLNQILEKTYSQKQLTVIPFEPYNIISRVPIHGPADMKGRKISCAGPNVFWIEDVGGLPLSITGPEVYTGFQSGLMDGNVVFMSIMDTLQLYSVAPYLIDIGFGCMSTAAIHVNTRRLSRLPKEIQDIIVEVGRDTEEFGGKYTQEMIDKYEGIIKEKGAKIIKVDDAARREWADALKATPGKMAQKFDREAHIPMSATMNAYITATQAEGFKWPVQYKI
jgi:C4-dicarboxylate-binding protein DctP